MRRWATLLAINFVGSVLLLPAFAHISYFDLDGIPKFLAITWLGVSVLGLLLWPQVSRSRLSFALPVSLLIVDIPSTVAWGTVMRAVFFQGAPTLDELYRLASSASLVGGVFTASFWLPLTLVNCWVLRRAA